MQRRTSPSVARNREPLFDTLSALLPPSGVVVEVAAGTGEHGAYFAPRFPGLTWISTDRDPDALASIEAWRAETRCDTWMPSIDLDVRADVWPVAHADAILCVNMVHISPWECTIALFSGASRVVPPGGVVVTYGPYRIDGQHTAQSNVTFDAWLKAQDPAFGVRDLEAVTQVAHAAGFTLEQRTAMPANNFTLAFRRS